MMDWQPVRGYEGRYEVSSTGEVRRLNGEHVGQWMSDQGYMLVRLAQPRKALLVHRLVAIAFVPNLDEKPDVNHIDCIRHHNAAANLEWITQAENLRHSNNLGRMRWNNRLGCRSPRRLLTDEAVLAIKKKRASSNLSLAAIAKEFGTSKRTVGRILDGESYING